MNSPAAAHPFRLRSKPYLAHVRTFPCLNCGKHAEAHHLQRAQPRALALKTGDQWVVPLCHTCHMQLHALGDETLWWDLLGIDPMTWAATCYGNWSNSNDRTNA